MKILLIMRHAKSSWRDDGLSDHDRPLNKRGRRDAPRMARLLVEEGLTPDLIISSTALRAVGTAEAVADEGGYQVELEFRRDLYLAAAEASIEILRDFADDAAIVMLVGHNPGMEELIHDLHGDYMRMPTAAIAHVQLPIDTWSEMDEATEGELVHLWRPKELP